MIASVFGDVGTFCRAVFSGWVRAATGGALVAFAGTYLGIFQPAATIVRVISAGVFGAALVIAVFNAWRQEYRRRIELERVPQLRLVFAPDVIPYEQDMPVSDGDFAHYFRVGVAHDGLGQVEDVRVLLELDPGVTRADGFPYLHALGPMGESRSPNGKATGVSSCSVAGGAEPTRFFDVVIQIRRRMILATNQDPPKEYMMAVGQLVVPFAAGDRPGVPPAISMRLVADGRNAKRAELRLAMSYTAPSGQLRLDAQL